MIVYIPAGSGWRRELYVEHGAGLIVQRYHWRNPKYDAPWILDNGAFDDWKHGRDFDGDQFERVLEKALKLQRCQWPKWSVIPDRVAHPGSLAFSASWRPRLPDAIAWYLALQDGMTEQLVELAVQAMKVDGLFVGGSLTWKNETASKWCGLGKRLGLPVHIGRVNGIRRAEWALGIGAASIDGTGFIARASDWAPRLKDLAADPDPEILFRRGR